MATFRYLSGVVTLELDAAKCNGCGMCTTVCPHAVFALADGQARIVDRDACMECGACASNCLSGAVTVDAGVGCATAIIQSALSGAESPTCDCTGSSRCCG